MKAKEAAPTPFTEGCPPHHHRMRNKAWARRSRTEFPPVVRRPRPRPRPPRPNNAVHRLCQPCGSALNRAQFTCIHRCRNGRDAFIRFGWKTLFCASCTCGAGFWPRWPTVPSPFSTGAPRPVAGTWPTTTCWTWASRTIRSAAWSECTTRCGADTETGSSSSIPSRWASRRPSTPIRGRKVKWDKWPGPGTGSGYPSDWTPPSGSSTRTRIYTSKTSTSSPTLAKCWVSLFQSRCWPLKWITLSRYS